MLYMTQFVVATVFCLITTISFAQTQGQLNEEAEKKYQKADKELNSFYQTILTEYKEDTAFIKNFKTAQRLWVQFRGAEMKAKYPDRESGYYGSVQPMCWYMYLTDLTEERTKKLKVWLIGIEEGDVCSGSVKTKN